MEENSDIVSLNISANEGSKLYLDSSFQVKEIFSDLSTENFQEKENCSVIPTENYQVKEKCPDFPIENSQMKEECSDLPTENCQMKEECSNLPTQIYQVNEKGFELSTEICQVNKDGSDLPTEKCQEQEKCLDLPVAKFTNLPTGDIQEKAKFSNLSTESCVEKNITSKMAYGQVQREEENPKVQKEDFQVDKSNSNFPAEAFVEETIKMPDEDIQVVLRSSEQAESLKEKEESVFKEAVGVQTESSSFPMDNMVVENGNLESEIFLEDCKFVQDLFLFIYNKRKFDKAKVFHLKLHGSPLTLKLKAICHIILKKKEMEMFMVFMLEKRLYGVSKHTADNISRYCLEVFQERPFCPKAFLLLCLTVLNHAVLACNMGIYNSGFDVMRNILNYLKNLRRMGKFPDNFWKMIEKAGHEMTSQVLFR